MIGKVNYLPSYSVNRGSFLFLTSLRKYTHKTKQDLKRYLSQSSDIELAG